MFSYEDHFKEKLQALQDSGRYRHFLAIKKEIRDFPSFISWMIRD
jgi:phage tail tape-measure protein